MNRFRRGGLHDRKEEQEGLVARCLVVRLVDVIHDRYSKDRNEAQDAVRGF